MADHVAIIGAGQAGAAVAEKLRANGFQGPITLFGEEAHEPYQRPPLSKKFLSGEWPAERLAIRSPTHWPSKQIELVTSTPVTAVDIQAKTLTAGNISIPWTKLVFATGAAPRPRPPEFTGRSNVYELRGLDDAIRLKAVMHPGQSMVVIGGGYVGLETAAVAVKLGLQVTVIERASRILERVACERTASILREIHRQNGVQIIEGCKVQKVTGVEQASTVTLDDGRVIDADIILVGIGVLPHTILAQASGIACDDGILVDAFGRTSAQDVWAAGDCARFPLNGEMIRLESVPNAIDQAECIADDIVGQSRPYSPIPWFWSDQYDLKLQMVGLTNGFDTRIERATDKGQSLWYFRQGHMLGTVAINDPSAFMATKKMLTTATTPSLAEAADSAFDPIQWMKKASQKAA